MKRQILLSLLVIVFVGFSLCGCSSINSVTTFYLDGSRSYYYQITVDKQECQALSIDADQVMQKISTLAQNYCTSFIETAQAQGRSTDGVNVRNQINSQNEYMYEINITFASFEAYCNFYDITQEDLDNHKTTYERNLFTSKAIIIDNEIETQQDLVFSIGAPVNWEDIKQSFADEFFGGDVASCDALLKKINFNIVFCFPSQYRYKSNASQITQGTLATGVSDTTATYYTAHLWKCTLATPTPHIYVYKNVVTSQNRIAWYLLAIAITLIVGIIVGIYLYRKQKFKQETITQFLKVLNSQPNESYKISGQQLTKEDIQKIAKQENIPVEEIEAKLQQIDSEEQNNIDNTQKDDENK